MQFCKRFTERRATPSRDESPKQHNPACTFSDLIDLWARARHPKMPYHQAIDYAIGCAGFRPGEIRILDSCSAVNALFHLMRTDRKL
jgi:hypothetical protein